MSCALQECPSGRSLAIDRVRIRRSSVAAIDPMSKRECLGPTDETLGQPRGTGTAPIKMTPVAVLTRAVNSLKMIHALSLNEAEITQIATGGLTSAARRAGIWKRTLQRRLADGGLTTRACVKEIRVRSAIEMIRSGMSTRVAARTLGFQNVAAFRAFLRRDGRLGVRALRNGTGAESEWKCPCPGASAS